MNHAVASASSRRIIAEVNYPPKVFTIAVASASKVDSNCPAVTLRICHDGQVVHTARVTQKREVYEAMEQFPPPNARGGVVSVCDGRHTQIVAISGHSLTGPVWALS